MVGWREGGGGGDGGWAWLDSGSPFFGSWIREGMKGLGTETIVSKKGREEANGSKKATGEGRQSHPLLEQPTPTTDKSMLRTFRKPSSCTNSACFTSCGGAGLVLPGRPRRCCLVRLTLAADAGWPLHGWPSHTSCRHLYVGGVGAECVNGERQSRKTGTSWMMHVGGTRVRKQASISSSN